MHHLRMPPQILRLVLLAAGIVASYVVARAFLTPPTFGQYGHYRGAALEQVASKPLHFAGAKSCDECHEEVREKLAKQEHKSLSCEGCHGASRAHALDPDAAIRKPTDATCLRCHAIDPARPRMIKQIAANDHFEGDRCIECHVPHAPKEEPNEKKP